jgi:hypothetical protein
MEDFNCTSNFQQVSGTFSLLGLGGNACLSTTLTLLDPVVRDGLVNGNAIVVTLSSRWQLMVTQTKHAVCYSQAFFLLRLNLFGSPRGNSSFISTCSLPQLFTKSTIWEMTLNAKFL